MPRTDPRGGPETRARIAGIASGLFAEHGFESVSVAEVARAAGVSSVTVFKHFPRKEDLYLDRSADAEALLVDAAAQDDPLAALEAALRRIAHERLPLSGMAPDSVMFLRTVAASPALVARAREIAAHLQATYAGALGDRDASVDDPGPLERSARDDADLQAAFVVSGYTSVFVATASGLLDGVDPDVLADAHRERLDSLFAALRGGVAGRGRSTDHAAPDPRTH